jgi:hypothetical protein
VEVTAQLGIEEHGPDVLADAGAVREVLALAGDFDPQLRAPHPDAVRPGAPNDRLDACLVTIRMNDGAAREVFGPFRADRWRHLAGYGPR